MSNKKSPSHESKVAFWNANLRLLGILLAIWAVVGWGLSIFLVDFLDQFSFFGFKLGFWFAQQGAIYVFVVLIFVYAVMAHRIDRKYDVSDD